MKEINVLKKMNHPNIIKFIDAKKTENNIYLIMEFCNGGSLEEFIAKNKGNLGNFEFIFFQRKWKFFIISGKFQTHLDI